MATATRTTHKSTHKGKAPAKKRVSPKNNGLSSSYNEFKNYKGEFYTGMAVGRSHKWNYDRGVWRETKITPERWELTYDVKKRRAGHAPKGSGVPVGTGYHWFILSHQYVEKLNEDDYSTSMVGVKFKLAHRRAEKATWNASDDAQRAHLIKILHDFIRELEEEPEKTVPINLEFDYRGKNYSGVAIPVMSSCDDGICHQLDITLNKKHLGVIKNKREGWHITGVPQGLTNV